MAGPMSSRVSKSRPSKASPPVRSKAMMPPEASDFAWIFVVKPPRERPSACPSCPLLLRRPTHAHARWSSRTLDQMRGRTHRGERVEEGFENASLAQPVEALPYAVPRTETFRQSPAPDVFDGEEMKPFEEAPPAAGPDIVMLPHFRGRWG